MLVVNLSEMKNVLVIGGSGFLGAALLAALKQAGVARLVSFDQVACPDSDVEALTGDLRNPEQVLQACAGMDTVFQTAALVDWGPRSRPRLLAVNVDGNHHVIAACQRQGVARLVYTSSIDVVFDGRPIRDGDETLPYPRRHLDDYGATKAQGEQDALAANTATGLQTCALRTGGIYGPGDRHRFPSILRAARQGQLVFLGDGRARFSHVYLANVVAAHLQAARALRPGSSVSGQAYFITDHEPQNFYTFFEPYLQELGIPIPRRRIPEALAYALALAQESLGRLGIGPQPPLLTRYVVRSTCRDFYFSAAKAQRDFGYQPIVSQDQAFAETLHWLKSSPQ
ncbi:MAG: NAD-dependent epimerase/dehydratase family protein [Anaerolineales bacterium]|nr:NAD-dependent epimerase/dehydratase family protein [Anaerolineales bacterium]